MPSRAKTCTMIRSSCGFQVSVRTASCRLHATQSKMWLTGVWLFSLYIHRASFFLAGCVSSFPRYNADNGGPIYKGGGGNNYPLRGGKITDWEGGVRVAAMVSGGVVPVARRNSTYDGVTHVADWLATFTDAAGLPAPVDAEAAAAGLPAFDSLSLLDAIRTGAPSPRQGKPLMLSSPYSDQVISHGTKSTVLILDNWKLIEGTALSGLWTGPTYPNASGYPSAAQQEAATVKCGTSSVHKSAKVGCLFDVVADPSEHYNVAAENPQVVAKMHALLEKELATVYAPDRGCDNNECAAAACAAAAEAGGVWAPFMP